MKYINSIIALLLLIACNSKEEDPTPEDYQKLFPFKGIEKPTINYEDLVHKQCDIEHFVYPSIDAPQEAREYTVTLTYQCQRGEGNVRDPRYYVCYVNANKERGGGERESRVSAQLTAVDTQGVVNVPTLQYIAAQNTDGTDNITPYCEYIVLP